MNKKILIGKINSAFGIKGEVKIISYCQYPSDIEKYKLFDKNNCELKLKISNKNKAVIGSNSSGGAILIAKIHGIEDRNAAEKICGAEIFTDRNDFKKISDDEFYQVDLIGLNVIDSCGSKVGKVLNVMDFGAGSMLEIEFDNPDAKKNLEKIENFPFKNEFFPNVNLQDQTITINIPDIGVIK